MEQSVKLTPGIADRTANALNAKFCIRVMRFNIRLRSHSLPVKREAVRINHVFLLQVVLRFHQIQTPLSTAFYS